MQKLLTIVVPMYNVEKYVRKCLGSFVMPDKEKMNSLEVLCINDGSPDHSSDIAKQFQAKYPATYRVIDKTNGNYCSCINCGLAKAKGKYIRICDGDDSYDTASLESFIFKLTTLDVDMVITDFFTVDNNGNVICRQNIRESLPQLPVNEVFDMKAYNSENDFNIITQMHCSTYRTTMLRDINYHQTEGISYTDQQWAIIPLLHAKTAYYQPIFVYQYLLGREGQTMDADNKVKYVPQLLHVVLDLAKYYEHGTYDAFYKPLLLRRISCQLYNFYPDTLLFNKGDFKVLADFDKKMTQYPDVYDMIGNSRSYIHGHLKYIKLWRKGNYKPLPFLFRKLCIWLEMRIRRRSETI